MMYAKTSIAHVATLLALCADQSEAFVPLGGAVGLSKGRSATTATWRSAVPASCRTRRRSGPCMSAGDEPDILLRVAKGEKADRAPVWLMRQVSAAAAVLLRLQPLGHILVLLFCGRFSLFSDHAPSSTDTSSTGPTSEICCCCSLRSLNPLFRAQYSNSNSSTTHPSTAATTY